VHVYVINLERSSERRAHIVREVRRTGMEFEVVTAVDGREVDVADATLVDPRLTERLGVPADAGNTIYRGTVGCALSHLQVYRTVLARGLDRALVLEDDVILPEDLGDLADDVGRRLAGAEIALLNYDSPENAGPCRMSPRGSVPLTSGRLLALPVDVRQPRSGGAYIVTREACERLVRSVLPVRVYADDWWFYYREGVVDRVRCVVPLPVRKSPDLASTIGSYSVTTGLKARVANGLLHRSIPGLHQALNYRRRLIYRRFGPPELVDVPFVERPSRLD